MKWIIMLLLLLPVALADCPASVCVQEAVPVCEQGDYDPLTKECVYTPPVATSGGGGGGSQPFEENRGYEEFHMDPPGPGYNPWAVQFWKNIPWNIIIFIFGSLFAICFIILNNSHLKKCSACDKKMTYMECIKNGGYCLEHRYLKNELHRQSTDRT